MIYTDPAETGKDKTGVNIYNKEKRIEILFGNMTGLQKHLLKHFEKYKKKKSDF